MGYRLRCGNPECGRFSIHHNIHQHRLARAKLNLPTHIIKPRSTPTKLTNYLNKTNANKFRINSRIADIRLHTDVRKRQITSSHVLFPTQFAAHFSKSHITCPTEPLALIKPAKPFSKQPPQTHQGIPPHSSRLQSIQRVAPEILP